MESELVDTVKIWNALVPLCVQGCADVVQLYTTEDLTVQGRLRNVRYGRTFMEAFKPRNAYAVLLLDYQFDGGFVPERAQEETDALVTLCQNADVVVLEHRDPLYESVFHPSILVNERKKVLDILIDRTIPGYDHSRVFQAWR